MPPIIPLDDSNSSIIHLDDDENTFDAAQPFLGVVLCCTSIPTDERAVIADKAAQMGALHKYDLTSEVTHLIAGDYDTPKYRYVAKERSDIKVVTPSYIDAVNDLWKEDQPIDLSSLELKHKRSVFQDLKICLTGFECMEERLDISARITEHGGTYSGDLTKQITHLIAFKPEGSKYQYAKTWRIQTVAIEWLNQSIERGMILDEKLYSLDIPAEERGRGAWKQVLSRTIPRKRTSSVMGALEGHRKLRRTMSKKLNSQNDQIWGDIMGANARSEGLDSPGQWDRPEERSELQVSRSMVMPAHAQPTQLLADIRPILHMGRGGAMDGCTIFIHGFNPKHEGHIRTIVESYDAVVTTSFKELYTSATALSLMVVPHDITPAKMPVIPPTAKVEVVTEFWIERCMDAKSFIRPVDYRLGKPFLKRPVPGLKDLVMCSTGLTGVQVLQLSKIVKLLGATYDETFSKDHSVLICNKDRPIRAEKLQFAKAWSIPVVSLDWLFACADRGAVQAFQPYLRVAGTALEALLRPAPKQAETTRRDEFDDARSAKANSQTVTPLKKDISVLQEDESIAVDEDIHLHNVVPEKLPSVSPVIRAASADPRISRDEETRSKLEIEPQVATPLAEISTNSPRKTLPPTGNPPQKDMTFAISSLLASAKSTIPSATDEPTASKRRQGRILGRAVSNVSIGSARESRAGSIESIATNSQATAFTASNKFGRTTSDDFRSSRLDYATPEELDNNDTQYRGSTQLGYEDEASEEHKEKLLAMIEGKTRTRRKVDNVITIGSTDSAPEPISMRTRQR